ncbi:MAG: peptidoglycan-binding domain-containing protein [bacterium]|nr:peptidoglycan-binding domain-containing protein [bacterium]
MTITHSSTRLIAVAAGTVVALGLLFAAAAGPARAAALTVARVDAIVALLQSFGADATTVANVTASLKGQATPGTPGSTGGACPVLTRDLKLGSTGADVMSLQQFLNSSATTQVASAGAGSPGSESTYFGGLTKAAVMKFQAANNVSPIAGYVGSITRAAITAVCGKVVVIPPPVVPGTPVTTGTGLSITAATQPANGIAPLNAARIPFTKFTVTASSDGDVTLNSVTVERQGIAQDAAFSGVMLLDDMGNQVGITKTLNSNHQTVVGSAVVIPRGTSKTFTVAANRGSATGYSGQIATFAVVAVNSSAAVNGSLPIVGASYTINEATSFIGSVTAARGTNDPGAANTNNVGLKNFIFSSIRVTAGSQEKVYVKSIRWHQIGSASQSYLANVVSLVDGVSYPTVVSTDSYYTTTFPGDGLLLDKGFSKDLAIQGDIVNGSATTVEFDIQKSSDINTVGQLYGYGILPAVGSNTCATADTSRSKVCTTDDPYYEASIVTINAGTMTVSTGSVSASNVAINQQGQTLGGWAVALQGEEITVGKLIFNLFTSSHANVYAEITNVSLVDQNGAVLAGPVDATAGTVSTVNAVLTFTDTVTFPTGTTNIYLKGKLGTNFVTNDTVVASTTPGSGWTTVTGQTTGRTITPTPSTALTSATMTVKAASLSVSVSSVPIAQTVIAGNNQFTFANYILDATASGEDIRVTTLPLMYDWVGNANDLTNCYLYNGTTNVTSTHVFVPSSATAPATAADTTFTMDSGGLTVLKGSSLTIALKCDVRSGVSGNYGWGINAASDTAYTGATGVTSGSTATGATSFTATTTSNTMTAASGGALSALLDNNSPGYKIVSAGTAGVELARLKFSATNEAVDLRQVALQLTSVASNTPTDLVGRQVTLWDADTLLQVGTAVFPSGDNATSSQILAGAFRIPANGSKVMIIKGDIAAITASGPLTASGDLLAVDYDGDNVLTTAGTYGVGVSSNTNVQPTQADTASAGVRIAKGYPVFAAVTLPSNTLAAGANKVLYRFSVKATDSDVALYKLSFDVGSSTVSATSSVFGLYAYTDSGFSSADTTFSSTGLLNANNYINSWGINSTAAYAVGYLSLTHGLVEVFMDKATATTTYIVPKGATRYFELNSTISSVETGTGSESINVMLLGDAAFPVNSATLFSTSTSVDGDTNDDLVWSPISTTTQNTINDLDFTNGYQVTGLPGVNMTAQTLTSTN